MRKLGRSSYERCECGHLDNEHAWRYRKGISGFLGQGFLLTPPEERIACRRCSCPKFCSLSNLVSLRDIEYRKLPQDYSDENRCSRCGLLLISHKNSNHPFQK